MTRAQLTRLAMRAYPEGVRVSRGPEMLATLLDLSDGSSGAFARELCDLFRSGLRSRSRATAADGLKRLIADGFCLAAMLGIAARISTSYGFQPGRWQFWLIGAALALGLIGYDRAAGLVGLGWILATNPAAPFGGHVVTAYNTAVPLVIALDLGLMIPLLVMALAPRRRQRDLRRLGWLMPVAAVGFAWSLGTGAYVIAIYGVSLIGLATLATSPRLAVAASLWWTSIGIELLLLADGSISPLGLGLALPAPTILAITVARVRHLEQHTPA
jgi:hypothetical protein